MLPRFTPPSSNFGTLFDCAAKSEQIVAVDVKMAQPDFWNDQEAAQDTVARRKSLLAIVKPLDEALASSEDLAAMLEMAAEDESFADEVPGEVQRLEAIVEQLKLQALLNGTHDAAGAIVTIHARDGGTDANDWAEMLRRF